MKPTWSWYVAAAILLASLVCGAKAASQPVSEHRCGDSVCEKSETAQSCLADCAAQAAMPLADQPYWPSFAYDRRNTGRSPHTGPLSARIAWTYPAPKARTINQQQTVDADGTIYFATWGSVEGDELGHGMLYALNPDGSLKWTYDPGLPKDQVGTIETTVTIGLDGTLHFGRGDGVLYAVDPDGTKIWTFETFSNTLRGQIVSSPAIAGDGTIYFGTVCYPLLGMCVAGTNAFYALSPDGSLKWTYPEDAMEGGSLSHWVLCNPAIGDDGTVYFTSFRTLYAFYPNGQERWHYDAGDRLWTPTIGDDGTIYVQAFTYLAHGVVYAINSNGSLKWTYPVTEPQVSTIAVGADGTLYFGSEAGRDAEDRQIGKLYALVDCGQDCVQEKWPEPLDFGLGVGGPAIDAQGTIYVSLVGDLDASPPIPGRVVAVRDTGQSGEILWSVEANGEIWMGSPVVGSDSTIYFADAMCRGTEECDEDTEVPSVYAVKAEQFSIHLPIVLR